MDNRKIIITCYLVAGLIVWFLSRSTIQYAYLTFYQIRRLPGIGFGREVLPFLLGAALFVFFLRHARVNTVMEEVVSELRKVTWPSRPEVVRSTSVVIVCIVIASAILGTFDMVWGRVIGYLLNNG